jgi:subtilisin family serine protease
MNKFTTISTKDYVPLSHKEEYFHNKYELIKSFLEKEFGDDYANILALPQIRNREVDWNSKYSTVLKRVTNFSKSEQKKVLDIYWKKINKIKTLTSSFHNSNSDEKREWANLLDEAFNSDNNIVFSDGENIVLLWGWKFHNSSENYIPEPVISTSDKIKDNTIFEPVEDDNPIPIIPPDPIDDPIVPKLPWYILFWEWIKQFFTRFWWILLLLLILWFLLNLDGCSCNDIEHPPSPNTNTEETQETIYDNNPENQPNNWDPENNNTGLPEEEFNQIIENNLPPELYENLLTDENGEPYSDFLPNKERVHIPFNPDNLIEDENTHQMVVPDRINIVVKDRNVKLEDFAKDFKSEFPSNDYLIIQKDSKIRKMVIRVPETERVTIKDKIKKKLTNYNLLIWDETIFQGNSFSFNDPDLKDKNRNYYFENINMSDAWKITTGKKDVIIAVIDDGFDLNHDELNDNIVKPYNVLYQNDKVYANRELDHGTHVAGLAISEKNNGKGVCGIAPDCSFMPIQATNTGDGFTMSAIIDGVLYAINNGADVINLSIHMKYGEDKGAENTGDENRKKFKKITEEELNLGGDDELFWNELFQMANDSNITIVFCAGNCEVLVGLDAMKRYDNIITVSATDQNDEKVWFSNHGERSTISAPGVDIWSCKPGGDFTMMDGTSMSSPIIAGVVGLMKSVNPDLTNKEIIKILKETGKPIDGIGPLVQVDKALKAVVIDSKEEKNDQETEKQTPEEELSSEESKNLEELEEKKKKESDSTKDFYLYLLIVVGVLIFFFIFKKHVLKK